MKKSLRNSLLSAVATVSLASIALAPVANYVSAEETEEGVLEFETKVEHEGEPIEGGTLKVAQVGTSFEGLLNNLVYKSNSDAGVIGYFNPGLYGFDENFVIDDSGFASLEFDQENKQVTITIPEGHTWHDGEPITIDDVILPYYVIGHPDYTGIRYGEDYMNVVGMDEYHSGDAEEISGLERVDDYTLTVTYHEFNNSLLQAGGGVGNFIEPSHIFEDVPVAELEDNEYVRTNPIGFGPFKVEKITPGEAVTYTAFEDYYEGAPNVDGLILEVVNDSTIIQELKAGNYDIATLPADQYETWKDATNFTPLGYVGNAYTYIGFKHGTWDAELGENVVDESLIVTNKALRQAMAHAIDNNAVGANFYNGLRLNANSFITPNFTAYYDPELPYFEYDPEKAKEVLAEAGFVDNDGDGFVEDPEGNPFTLNFASMSGGETAEPLAQYYLQSWQAVGIDVQLLDGQLHEINSFYERVENDDPDIHVYQAAWTTGGDPNPSGLYGRVAKFNYLRWATEENDKLIADISSDKSFDEEFRTQAYKDWQEYIMEEIPAIPTLFRYNLTAVNKRVNIYDVQIGNDMKWSDLYLLADEPMAD